MTRVRARGLAVLTGLVVTTVLACGTQGGGEPGAPAAQPSAPQVGSPAPVPLVTAHARPAFVPNRIEAASEDRARAALPPVAEPLIVSMAGVPYRIALDETEEHATLIGPPLPAGARLVRVTELPEVDLGVALPGWAIVRPDGRVAHLEGDATYSLERAPALATSPTLTGAAALAATQSLRYLRTCPISRRECLVFGPPADVAAAVDPVAPPGGWFLDREPALGPGQPTGPATPLPDAPGLTAAPLPPDPDGAERIRVFARIGHRTVPAFDIPAGEALKGGLVAHAGETVVWLRDLELVRLRVAVFDATGTRRLVAGARADAYEPVFCGNVYTSTRLLPVLQGDRVALALGWSGMTEAILFDPPGRRGRVVPARHAEAGEGYFDSSDLAPLWTVAADGSLTPDVGGGV